jgi:glucan phosphorylase
MTQHTDTSKDTMAGVKDTAKDAAEDVQQKAGKLTDEVKSQAIEITEEAKVQAKSVIEDRKEMAARELGSVAEAFRQTSSSLREQDQAMFAQYSNRVADQVERVSSYLEDHNLDDMIHDSEDFARRQPELFIGGAFTLGLLAARFLKSSASSSRSMSQSTTATGGTGGMYYQGNRARLNDYEDREDAYRSGYQGNIRRGDETFSTTGMTGSVSSAGNPYTELRED